MQRSWAERALRWWLAAAVVLVLLAGVLLAGPALAQSAQRNRASLWLLHYVMDRAAPDAGHALARARAALHALQPDDPERHSLIVQRLEGQAALRQSASFAGHQEARALVQRALAGEAGAQEFDRLEQLAASGDEMAPEAAVALAEVWSGQGQEAQALDAVQRALGAPWTPTSTRVCEGWTLAGSWVNRWDLALGEPVRLLLAWGRPEAAAQPILGARQPGPEPSASWQIWAWDETLLQAGTAENLIPDGGFELEVAPGRQGPRQLPKPLFTQQTAADTTVVYEDAARAENLVLQLQGHGNAAVGVASRTLVLPLPHEGYAYLLTVRYRTEEGADPTTGIQWYVADGGEMRLGPLLPIGRQPSDAWRTSRLLAAPPAGIDALALWVMNQNADRWLQVDDLGLFLVPLPCTGTIDGMETGG